MMIECMVWTDGWILDTVDWVIMVEIKVKQLRGEACFIHPREDKFVRIGQPHAGLRDPCQRAGETNQHRGLHRHVFHIISHFIL